MGSGFQGLRLVATVGLACGITWTICHALGLGEATPYGVVIAAVMVRPRFDRWPRPVFVLLPLVVMFCMDIDRTMIFIGTTELLCIIFRNSGR